MITANGFEQINTEVYNGQLVSKCKYDLVGLSTDTKPTGRLTQQAETIEDLTMRLSEAEALLSIARGEGGS
jgi:hypothetical protein